MKFLSILIILFFTTTSKASDNIDLSTAIKISTPVWYVNKLGNSFPQVWLINKENKIQFIHDDAVNEDIIQALSHAPDKLKNTPKVTYQQLIKVQPQLEPAIKLAFQKGANYVVLDISIDKSLVKQDPLSDAKKTDNFCPPCKAQTDKLMTLNNKDITVLKLRLAM